MTRRTKRRLKKTIFILLGVLLVVAIALYLLLFRSGETGDKSNVVEQIKGYSYTLDDRDTVYMRTTFRELKTVLTAKELDYEKYAELLTKLYVIDLYTIKNKTSRYDAGAYEYVHPDSTENFKLQVGDTLYKYIGSKSMPEKELPEVVNVEVSNIEDTKYTYKDKEYDGYTLDVKWEYKNISKYDTSASVTAMKDGKMVYIVEFEPEVSK